MLRMCVSSGGNAAKSYFFGGLTYGDSYFDGQERAGEWIGTAARYLGLKGQVRTREWCRMCDNRHPTEDKRLTLRTKVNRRAAFDFTFNVPKGVSYAALVMADQRVLEAARQSVRETLEHMEQFVFTRVRKNGARSDRVTGNFVGGLFEHYTSRPVEGAVPDPNLHFHAYFFNATFDITEAAWKAVELDRIVRALPYFESYFHSRLAQLVAALGYDIELKGPFWDIGSISKKVREFFSKRTEQIDAIAKARNITDAERKSQIGARSRRGKVRVFTMTELREIWRRDTERVLGTGEKVQEPPKRRGVQSVPPKELLEAIRGACGVAFEHSSTTSEQRLVERVLRRYLGRTTAEEIRDALPKCGVLVREQNGYRIATSKEVLAEEKTIVEITMRGRGKFAPSAAKPEIPEHFTEGQRGAIDHVLNSTDRVVVINGFAGTGKSEVLKVLKPALNGMVREHLGRSVKAGRTPIESFVHNLVGEKVVVLAPTGVASRERLRPEGFGDADTVAKFLIDPELQAIARKGAILLDEAAQLGTKAGLDLWRLAEKLDARIVCFGDNKQTRSPMRGDLVNLLVRHAGVRTSNMEQIVRQRGFMLTVAHALREGEPLRAFELLEGERRVHIGRTSELRQHVASAYVGLEKSGRRSTVMVPTHAEIKRMDGEIREARRRAGLLRADREYVKYVPVKNADYSRSEPGFYKPGMLLRFHEKTGRLFPGEQARVVRKTPLDTLLVSSAKGLQVLNLRNPTWSAYEKESIQVAPGDLLRITANTRVFSAWDRIRRAGNEAIGAEHHRFEYPTHQLHAGQVVEVKRIRVGGDIQTTSGLVIPKEFGHIEHAYCETVHSTQSLTFDVGLLWAPKDTLAAMSQNSFTTAATRARSGFHVFTDDRSGLVESIQRSDREMGAIDLELLGTPGVEKDKERARAAKQARDIGDEYEAYTNGMDQRSRSHERDMDMERE